MRWAFIQSDDQLRHWKLEDDQPDAGLSYNPKAHSFRITAQDKRLFFIERTGFLQHKFLLKTEYNIIAGETHPIRNWHSGIAVFENKKYHYLLKENILNLSSKKNHISFAIEFDNSAAPDQFEICALLFGSLRVLVQSYQSKSKAALV